VVSKKLMEACMTEVIVLKWRDFNPGYMNDLTAPATKNMMVNETPKTAEMAT
jgi:hypothetical protein